MSQTETPPAVRDEELTITVTDRAFRFIHDLSRETGESPTELIRKALGLLKTAHEVRKDGKHLGIAGDDGRLETGLDIFE